MRFTSSISLLGLALAFSGSHASPSGLGQLSSRQEHPDPEIEEYLTNRSKWCGLGEDIHDLETAKKALRVSTLGASLNIFLRTTNDMSPTNWVREIRKFILHEFEPGSQDGDGANGCATVGGDCDPGEEGWECPDYFDLGNPTTGKDVRYDWSKIGYWIFRSVKGVHAQLTEMDRFFTQEVIAQTLEIDGLAEKLKDAIDNSRVDLNRFLDGLAIGTEVLGTVSGALPGPGSAISTGLGIFGSMMDTLREDDDGAVVSVSDVKTNLATRFRRTTEQIENVLAAAMGKPIHENDYDLLAQFSTADDLDFPVANFMDNPFWLIEVTSPAFREVLDSMGKMMRQQLFASLIVASGLEIVGRNVGPRAAKDKDQCEGRNPGRRWLEVKGKSYCFGISKQGNGPELDWDTDIYGLMHGYGIDIFSQFYWNAIECILSGGVGDDGKPSEMDMVGEYPRCFFNIPVSLTYMRDDPNQQVAPSLDVSPLSPPRD